MKQQNAFERANRKKPQSVACSAGFITFMMFPVFFAILASATAMAGYLSYSIQAVAHQNKMMQGYALLEDDDAAWQAEVLSGGWKEADRKNYEKVVSTRNIGPYILLVKELRNKITGRVLVNRLEFMPIDKTDDSKL